VIVPRGRRGIGPKDMRDFWAWPTSVKAQAKVEAEIVHDLAQTKALLETRNGRPFERTYVFGFSNGAYYGAALALRGTLAVDGYALFAGGAAGYLKRYAAKIGRRPPIYVGYGERDATARQDCQRLGAALRALGWPYRLRGRRRVGHSMTDSQVKEALALFEHGR
jgi:predicted esterase